MPAPSKSVSVSLDHRLISSPGSNTPTPARHITAWGTTLTKDTSSLSVAFPFTLLDNAHRNPDFCNYLHSSQPHSDCILCVRINPCSPPVSSFPSSGTSLFVLITFILTALFVALSASLGIILFCCTFHCSPLFPTLTQTVGFLALVLFGILLASLFLTVAALMSYSFIRLALHIQREGPWNGVSEWQRETRNSLLAKQNNVTRFDRIVKKEEQEPSPTDVSEPGRGEAVEVKKS